MLYNPLQRLHRAFRQADIYHYGLVDLMEDLDESPRRDVFVATVLCQVPCDCTEDIRDTIKEEALATWFWWKLS